MQKISLVEFSVENWGVFKEKATLSMSARKNDGRTFVSNKENLLKTALIYGPNASGKSSLLNAFIDLKKTIITSANARVAVDESLLPHKPFLASKELVTLPTTYEVIFSLEDDGNSDLSGIYRYSFSVLPHKVVSEILVEITESGKERELIRRHDEQIITDKIFTEIYNFLVKQGDLPESALFLSVFAQLNNNLAASILGAFRKANVITGVTDQGYSRFTVDQFNENEEFKGKVLRYLQQADFCIKDGIAKSVDLNDSSGKMKKLLNIFFSHPVFNGSTEQIGSFEMPLHKESDGTKTFFHILGPVIDTIENGKVLFVDELDNSLHPLLTKFIIELFDSEEVNKKYAQLIATTHDTSLLAHKQLIKDQFWFTEKDACGAAKLFSLAEFAGSELRNNSEYSKKYLEGRFGALPLVGMITD